MTSSYDQHDHDNGYYHHSVSRIDSPQSLQNKAAEICKNLTRFDFSLPVHLRPYRRTDSTRLSVTCWSFSVDRYLWSLLTCPSLWLVLEIILKQWFLKGVTSGDSQAQQFYRGSLLPPLDFNSILQTSLHILRVEDNVLLLAAIDLHPPCAEVSPKLFWAHSHGLLHVPVWWCWQQNRGVVSKTHGGGLTALLLFFSCCLSAVQQAPSQ